MTDIVPASDRLVGECLDFDHLVAAGSAERRTELSAAAAQGRMRVAVLEGRAAGYSVVAPWFFAATFLELLYVDPAHRGRGIGAELLADFQREHGSHLFTSTNLSNVRMQGLLHRRGWTACGVLNGLDEGDPEVFFVSAG